MLEELRVRIPSGPGKFQRVYLTLIFDHTLDPN